MAVPQSIVEDCRTICPKRKLRLLLVFRAIPSRIRLDVTAQRSEHPIDLLHHKEAMENKGHKTGNASFLSQIMHRFGVVILCLAATSWATPLALYVRTTTTGCSSPLDHIDKLLIL